jgi:hypothetical protein
MSTKPALIKQLREELHSSNPTVVLDAIKKIRSEGHRDLIPDLVRLWLKEEGIIHTELTELLYTLKDNTVTEALIELLDQKEFADSKERILTIFWNAALDTRDHLSILVGTAIHGNYMQALEVLTIIENLDPPFPEEEIMDALIQLKGYFADPKSEKEEKFKLIQTITTIIKVHDDNQILD